MNQLYRTSGVPARFTCYYARKVQNASFVEKQLHAGLGSKRINPDREFFDIDPQEAKSLIEIAEGEDVTPENELEDATNIEKGLARRNMFRLKDFDIVPGCSLTFSNDHSITAEVSQDEKTIVLGDGAPEEMRGNTYSLSGAATQLLGYKVAGPDHWIYQGRTLNQIRREVEES